MKPSLLILILVLAVGTAGGAAASEGDTARIPTECRKYIYAVTAILGNDGALPVHPNRNVGTAISLDDRGHLLTMSSVVQGAERIEILTPSGERKIAEYLGSDITGRIAVLRLSDTPTEQPEIIPLHRLRTGQPVCALGVAPGMEVEDMIGSIADIRLGDGTVVIEGMTEMLTSGSPVFDEQERVIGLMAYRLDRTDAASPAFLAISMEYATVLAHQLITGNGTLCGWLGLCIDLSFTGDGISVKQVLDGSPAAKSGILPKDVIIGFNHITIESAGDFSDAVSRTAAGDDVMVTVRRSSAVKEFTIRLSSRPR